MRKEKKHRKSIIKSNVVSNMFSQQEQTKITVIRKVNTSFIIKQTQIKDKLWHELWWFLNSIQNCFASRENLMEIEISFSMMTSILLMIFSTVSSMILSIAVVMRKTAAITALSAWLRALEASSTRFSRSLRISLSEIQLNKELYFWSSSVRLKLN